MSDYESQVKASFEALAEASRRFQATLAEGFEDIGRALIEDPTETEPEEGRQ